MKEGKTLRLLPLSERDIELTRKWRNQYAENFFSHDYITKVQQKAWYEKYVENYGRDYMFLIQLKSGEKIGTIALYNINPADRTADVGRILLIDEFRGYDYMEEAIKLVVDLALNDMHLYKLRVEAFLDNVGAISLYHKCGFKSIARPVLLMEQTNHDLDWGQSITIMDVGGDDE